MAEGQKAPTYKEDHEGKKIKDAKTVYSLWSAAKYVLILSLLLWWLPMFGQMIAGYVGGRKAGSPWRGIISAILPVIAIFAIITAFEQGIFPNEILGVEIAPSAFLGGIASAVPFLGPYVDFTREYVAQFVMALEGSSPYEINSYILTIAFAYIGGIIAYQNRREIEVTSQLANSHTTVVMPPHGPQPPENIIRGPVPAVVPQQNVGFMPYHAPLAFVPRENYARKSAFSMFHFDGLRRKKVCPECFGRLTPENSMIEAQIIDDDNDVEIAPKLMRRKTKAKRGFDAIEEDFLEKPRMKAKRKAKKASKRGFLNWRKREPAEAAPEAPARKRSNRARKPVQPVHGKPRTSARKGSSKVVKISSKHPRSLRNANRMIEQEWTPKKSAKKRTVGKKPVSRIRSLESVEKGGKNRIRNRPKRSFARNWDMI